MNHSIIIGIDPGTVVTGYGIIKKEGSKCLTLDYGCIRPPVRNKLSERYLIIFDCIEELLIKYQPHVLVVESQYVKNNVQSALKLGMAKGVIIVAAKKRGIPVFEYFPTEAKRAVVGNGKASKRQVQKMIQMLLNLTEIPPEDAADALSLALCHSNGMNFPLTCNKEL